MWHSHQKNKTVVLPLVLFIWAVVLCPHRTHAHELIPLLVETHQQVYDIDGGLSFHASYCKFHDNYEDCLNTATHSHVYKIESNKLLIKTCSSAISSVSKVSVFSFSFSKYLPTKKPLLAYKYQDNAISCIRLLI